MTQPVESVSARRAAIKILRTAGAVLLYWLAFVAVGPLTAYAWKLMSRWLGL